MVDAQTTSEGVPAPPAPSELIARAEALVPLLRENAVEAERLRRLPESTIRGLEVAGMFRMTQPEHRGGYDSDPATVSEVTILIASGCPSTAWVMMIYSSVAQPYDFFTPAARRVFVSPWVNGSDTPGEGQGDA
jgi:3-hydroxy-9,10-secoandrosta-1,3,5(10)-triene-9,17-dione monooxygenase